MISKVSWDATFNVLEKKVGIRVIARNSKGDILACLGSSINATVKPVMAETMGLRSAMVFCHELGLSYVILEGNSQTRI